MVSKTAVDYVQKQLQSGFKPDAIKKAMLKAGWKEADVDAALAAAAPAETPRQKAVMEEEMKGKGSAFTPAQINVPGNEYATDIYSAAMAIGKILPALEPSEIESTLDELHEVADRHDFRKFAGLIETLKLTIEGKELEPMQIEIARVGPRIREVFEEELRKEKKRAKSE